MDKNLIIALVCITLGWVFLGLGVVLFPLGFVALWRADVMKSYPPPIFYTLVGVGLVGFIISLYLDSQLIAKYLL